MWYNKVTKRKVTWVKGLTKNMPFLRFNISPRLKFLHVLMQSNHSFESERSDGRDLELISLQLKEGCPYSFFVKYPNLLLVIAQYPSSFIGSMGCHKIGKLNLNPIHWIPFTFKQLMYHWEWFNSIPNLSEVRGSCLFYSGIIVLVLFWKDMRASTLFKAI